MPTPAYVTVLVTDSGTQKPIVGAVVDAQFTTPDTPGLPVTDVNGKVSYPALDILLTVTASGYNDYLAQPYNNLGLFSTIPIGLTKAAAPVPVPTPTPTPTSAVTFDHPWDAATLESDFPNITFPAGYAANVELALRALLSAGESGQPVVDELNSKGGIYAGAEFQPHHDQTGFPTYGFSWMYISDLNNGVAPASYQLVMFGAPPAGD